MREVLHGWNVRAQRELGQDGSSCCCRNRVLLLNLATDVINFWQDEAKKHTIEEAQEKYPQVSFQGN